MSVGESSSLPPAVFLMGPTAAGKTALALAIAERLPCDIVSVDSALVYRSMDIGTAKPAAEVLARFPHRLIDICDPTEAYSAARFRADALAALQDIHSRGRIPLLVGGTMLYFRALAQGLSELPERDPELRRDLARQLQRFGPEPLHRWLAALDPVSAGRIHARDPQRIQRALEVYLLTGRTLSAHWAAQARPFLPYRLVKLVQAPADRQRLRERIAERFDRMLACGFQDEVERLRARGDLSSDLPSMRSVGYRQMWQYLEGQYPFSRMRELAITATRQLAKRQMTWLRADTDTIWLPSPPAAALDDALRSIEASIFSHRDQR